MSEILAKSLQIGIFSRPPGNQDRGEWDVERRADARTRTGDPIITSDVLYQLSYVGVAPILPRPPAG